MDNLSPITAARFWSKVDVKRSLQECWEWQGCRKASGYGRFKMPGEGRVTENAHRVAYALVNGEIPTGLLIRHKCDNPKCCNPNHLETGTIADNSRDMVVRGRSKVLGRPQRGELNVSSKLTTEQIKDIRERIDSGETNISIANDYPVGHAAISKIRTGNSWTGSNRGPAD